MAQRIVTIPNLKIVCIIFEGNVSQSELNHVFLKLKELYEFDHFRKVLFDIRNQNNITSTNWLPQFISNNFAELYIAFIYSANCVTLDLIKNYNILRKGLIQCNAFKCEFEAFLWLKQIDLSNIHTAYDIDNNNDLIYVNDIWDEFAKENGGVNLISKKVIKKNIFQFIKDNKIKESLFDLIYICRASKNPISREYPCHSPFIKRFMKMLIIPRENGIISFEHFILRQEVI